MKSGIQNGVRNLRNEAVRQVREGDEGLRRVKMRGDSQMIGVLNPNEMSSDEILTEVAALLAKGYRQHLQRCGEEKMPGIGALWDYSSAAETDFDSPGRQPSCCYAG